ncbi:hypothetical protein F2P81_006068 [Scophthalmus maximus]|uniref:Uncharacterized protein n=1 Tax=Scophthalmus maximus TaxID=52904 RepID=A0A6A4T4Q9_SCOMX|nr:hypothetical protein F2P81_006068 [Scophthalmus maximus]
MNKAVQQKSRGPYEPCLSSPVPRPSVRVDRREGGAGRDRRISPRTGDVGIGTTNISISIRRNRNFLCMNRFIPGFKIFSVFAGTGMLYDLEGKRGVDKSVIREDGTLKELRRQWLQGKKKKIPLCFGEAQILGLVRTQRIHIRHDDDDDDDDN